MNHVRDHHSDQLEGRKGCIERFCGGTIHWCSLCKLPFLHQQHICHATPESTSSNASEGGPRRQAAGGERLRSHSGPSESMAVIVEQLIDMMASCPDSLLEQPMATATFLPTDYATLSRIYSLHTAVLEKATHEMERAATQTDIAAPALKTELLLAKLLLGPESIVGAKAQREPTGLQIQRRALKPLERAQSLLEQVRQQAASTATRSGVSEGSGNVSDKTADQPNEQSEDSRSDQGESSPGQADARIARKAERLAREGHYSRAMDFLQRVADGTAGVKVTMDATQLEKLRSMHPAEEAAKDHANAEPLHPSAEALRQQLGGFKQAWAKMKRRRAGGLSGWKIEHVNFRKYNHHLLPLLETMTWHIAAGHVPQCMQRFLFGASITPVPKKGLNNFRPVAVGEFFVKLAAKRLAMGPAGRLAGQKLKTRHQFGVGVKGGAEFVVNGSRAFLRAHPDMVLRKLDISNAFNTISRRLIRDRLVELGLSALLPYFDAHYPLSGEDSQCPVLVVLTDSGGYAVLLSLTGV